MFIYSKQIIKKKIIIVECNEHFYKFDTVHSSNNRERDDVLDVEDFIVIGIVMK